MSDTLHTKQAPGITSGLFFIQYLYKKNTNENLDKHSCSLFAEAVNDLYNEYRNMWIIGNTKRLYTVISTYVQHRYDNFFSYCHIA